MYCPKCNQEQDGKFCLECGSPLIEKSASQGGFNLNLGDANAIIGDLNLTDSHNTTNVSWRLLNVLINKPSWQTALGNQKGVYLLIDSKIGKQYVGSAYGQDMLLGRWEQYIKTSHGGNKELKILKETYIQDNFYFTILQTFNPNIDNQIIIARESY